MRGLIAFILAAGTTGLGCQKGSESETAAISVALSLPDGIMVNAVAWQVVSATETVLAAGITNTSNLSATPSVSFSVPPGVGDTVHMTATTTTGASCVGISEPFNVFAGHAVAVSLSISCGQAPPDAQLGTVVISGVLVQGDSCPVVTSWSVSPQKTSANGGIIDLALSATDADPGEALSFTWFATNGSFASPTAISTEYICGTAGSQTLSLTISDNHKPVSCTVTATFPPVDCL